MKKILCLCLALLVLTLFFVGCNESENKNSKSTTKSTTTAVSTTKFIQADLPYEATDDETDLIIIDVLNYGKIVVELYPETAPITVSNFKKLVSENFFDGLIFHRVIEGFMIQGGGFNESFQQKQTNSIKGEFSSNGVTNNLKHTRGVISMARTTVPDSATSQFFIMHKDSPHLDGDYAAFGNTVFGIEIVDAIASVATDYYDCPVTNVVISSIRFAKPIDTHTTNAQSH